MKKSSNLDFPRLMLRFLMLVAVIATLSSEVQAQNASDVPARIKELSVLEQLLQEARDLFDLGRYGAANQKCHQVLAFDHQNKEALHGLELIKQARAELAARPTDENNVANAVVYPQIVWELPSDPGSSPAEKAGIAASKAKLSTVLSSLEFNATPLRDVVAQLSEASHHYAPDRKEDGLTIEVQYPEQPPATNKSATKAPGQPSVTTLTSASDDGSAENPAVTELPGLPSGVEVATVSPPTSPSTPVTFRAANLSLLEVLKAIGKSVQMQVKVDPDKVSLVPLGTVTDEPLITIAIRVPRSFIGAPKDAEGHDIDVTDADARKFLEASGVTFPPGAKAVYLKRTSQLIVRDTQPNVDWVQALLY